MTANLPVEGEMILVVPERGSENRDFQKAVIENIGIINEEMII